MEILSRRGGSAEFRGPCFHESFSVIGPPWPPLGCDYIMLAVKAYDTQEALEWLRSYRVWAPVIVVVQNGIGGLEVAERLYHGLAAAGIADFGAERRGSLTILRGMGRFVAGCSRRDCSWALEPLSKCLSEGGLRTIIVDDVEPYRWLKLAVNAAINTVTAILRAPNGVILRNPHAREAALRIAEAVEREALRRGIRLPRPAGEEVLRVAELTADNRSSTLQDIERGSRTEVDYILGPVSEGDRAIALLYHIVMALEDASLEHSSMTPAGSSHQRLEEA